MAKKVEIPTSSGALDARYSTPEEEMIAGARRLLIVMVHDFPGRKSGNKDLFSDLEAMFLEKGLKTLRFDFRGCGKSPGEEIDFSFDSACSDFRAVLNWATQERFDHFIFIAEGVGAAAVIKHLPDNTNAMALLWPVLHPPAFAKALYSKEKIHEGPPKHVMQGDHKVSLDYIKQLSAATLQRELEDVTVPTLIMHGVQDKIVPISQLEAARQHINSKRVEITTFHDGEHGLQQLSHRKMIFYHLAQFVEKYT